MEAEMVAALRKSCLEEGEVASERGGGGAGIGGRRGRRERRPKKEVENIVKNRPRASLSCEDRRSSGRWRKSLERQTAEKKRAAESNGQGKTIDVARFFAPQVCLLLYIKISRHYPFLGDTFQETYDKIVNDPVQIPGDMNPQLADLLERLLCKDPVDRITLQAVAEHPWVAGDEVH